MIKTRRKLIVFFFLIFISLSMHVRAGSLLTEQQAMDILVSQIQQDKLYDGRHTLSCLSFSIEEKTKDFFDFAIREKHGGLCQGDPNAAPIVDRFRVMRATKKLLWYDVGEDKYVSYDPSRVTRQQ